MWLEVMPPTGTEMVPVPVIGPPVSPEPVATEVTVPPLLVDKGGNAPGRWRWGLGVRPPGEPKRARVRVSGPPVSPEPVATEVTVPPLLVSLSAPHAHAPPATLGIWPAAHAPTARLASGTVLEESLAPSMPEASRALVIPSGATETVPLVVKGPPVRPAPVATE